MSLKPGDKAPDFCLNNQTGDEKRLADYSGKKLVIYFYPKDDTPGCTTQSCNLRDNYHLLLEQGYQVVGVSVDDETSHRKFIDKFNLPFDLLADTEHKMVTDYGVWGEKNMYGRKYMGINRTTFVLDQQGEIEEVIRKVKTDDHTAQILKTLKFDN